MVCAEGTTRPNPHEPCPWDGVDPGSCDPCWADYSDEIKDQSVKLATTLLWRLSGKQFGECCITVRPCNEQCGDWYSTYTGWSGTGSGNSLLRPAIIDGRWVNCGCVSDCCGPDCLITLPVTPATSVSEVLVDGLPLGSWEYELLDRRQLRRVPWMTVYGVLQHQGQGTYRFDPSGDQEHAGTWNWFATGWTGGTDTPTAHAAGAMLTLTNPPPVAGVRGAFIRVRVPQGVEVQVNTFGTEQETVWRTRPPEGRPQELAGGIYRNIGGPHGPVEFVIRADGATSWQLTPSDPGVELLETGFMVPGGNECWPECNDWDKDVTEPGTWAVSYSWGSPVPADGLYAAGVLAVEFAKACVGDKACRLPRRVQSLSRQGVSVQFVDDGQYLQQGLLGLLEVDQWLKSINPYGLRERSRVYSPDKMQKMPARETWRG